MDSITARGFYVRCALRGYNNFNPTGLLEIQEGLTELKEMKKKSRRDEMSRPKIGLHKKKPNGKKM
jgi:hypothetical protein